MADTLTSDRLALRPWRESDAEEAWEIYHHPEVARWLHPAVTRPTSVAEMRELLRVWIRENEEALPPVGHWAIERNADGALLGGIVLEEMPPDREDLEIGCQLHPRFWGHGYATEAFRTLLRWAFQEQGVYEVFSVVRPRNRRAEAIAKRLGMEWVGETDKYYGLRLQVYRLRAGDLDHPPPGEPPRDDETSLGAD